MNFKRLLMLSHGLFAAQSHDDSHSAVVHLRLHDVHVPQLELAQGVSVGTLSVPACVHCKEPPTIPHLLRDCAALRDVRAQVWGEAQAFLQAKGSNGPLVRLEPTGTSRGSATPGTC